MKCHLTVHQTNLQDYQPIILIDISLHYKAQIGYLRLQLATVLILLSAFTPLPQPHATHNPFNHSADDVMNCFLELVCLNELEQLKKQTELLFEIIKPKFTLTVLSSGIYCRVFR
jgi:hypothetical protein